MVLRRVSFNLGVALVTALVAHTGTAGAAEPVVPAASTPARAADSTSPRDSLAGFAVLASGGYGVSMMNVGRLELVPYGATFGFDLGYTFRSGFRLGAYFERSLGGSKQQHYDPLIGRSSDFVAETSSLHGGISLGWDVPVSVLILRYGLGFGVSSMKWDFGSSPPVTTRFGQANNPTVGFCFTPSLALLYQHGLFEGGIAFDYLVQTSGTIPSGVLPHALVGVKW